LREKLGVEVPYLRQLKVFDGVGRDPRGWSLSILYCALLSQDAVQAAARSKVDDVRWVDANTVGRLAFDHSEHVAAARDALRGRVRDQALPLHLMPEKFTLTQLQRVCELILRDGSDDPLALDKGAFRRRLARSEDFAPVEGEFERGAQRPAQLYRVAPGFRF
jgi:ADP-ribose pyrophosphatase YjhB (NUDIX family)